MSETKGLSKDEKLMLALKIQGQIDLAKANRSEIYDVLLILAHLTFPDRKVELCVSGFILP